MLDKGRVSGEPGRLAGSRPFELSFAGCQVARFTDFQTRARARVFELLHHNPDPVDPAAEVVERVDRGACIREKIFFSTSPLFRVPAYVLIPKDRPRPMPAVADLHSHGGMFLFGKKKVMDLGPNHDVMVEYHKRNYGGRPTASELARRGYVVITIDAFAFGERRIVMEEDARYGRDRSKYNPEDARYLNRRCQSKESTLMKELAFAGATWPGVVFQDDIRTVDYLMTSKKSMPTASAAWASRWAATGPCSWRRSTRGSGPVAWSDSCRRSAR